MSDNIFNRAFINKTQHVGTFDTLAYQYIPPFDFEPRKYELKRFIMIRMESTLTGRLKTQAIELSEDVFEGMPSPRQAIHDALDKILDNLLKEEDNE